MVRKNKDCTECVNQNLDKKAQARKGGLCTKHYNKIHNVPTSDVDKNCNECVRQKISPIGKVHRKGLCELHYNEVQDEPQYCRVCVDTYVDPPKEVTSGYCEDHKNIKHIHKCKECVSLKVPKPLTVISNDLCVSHGAPPKKCRVCKIERPNNPNNAVHNGLCSEHHKVCEKCLELKVDKPRYARSGSKFCAGHKNK